MVQEVVAVTGPAVAAREAAVAPVANLYGPALGSCPHRGAGADVEGLAGTLEHVAHDPAVTRQAPERLDPDRRAVDQLGATHLLHEGVEVGDDMHGVAVDVTRLVQAGPAGSGQGHGRVGPALTCG